MPSTANERDRLYDLALIPAAVALNVAIGISVSALKLPVFLDAIGTISIVLMARRRDLSPMWSGMFVGVLSFVLTAILFNPTVIWFCHTQAAIAVYAFYVIRPIVMPEDGPTASVGFWLKIVASGIGLGLVAGTFSAPVIAYLFSGITPNGPGAISAFLIASGQTLYKSVLLSGLSCEPIDKTLQTLVAVSIYLSSPWRAGRVPARHT